MNSFKGRLGPRSFPRAFSALHYMIGKRVLPSFLRPKWTRSQSKVPQKVCLSQFKKCSLNDWPSFADFQKDSVPKAFFVLLYELP